MQSVWVQVLCAECLGAGFVCRVFGCRLCAVPKVFGYRFCVVRRELGTVSV